MRFGMIQLSGVCENCSLRCSLFSTMSDCFLDRLATNRRNDANRKRWFHQECCGTHGGPELVLPSEELEVLLLPREFDCLFVWPSTNSGNSMLSGNRLVTREHRLCIGVYNGSLKGN